MTPRSLFLLCLALSLVPVTGAQTALQLPPKSAMPPPLPPLPHPTLDRMHAAHAVNCGVVKEEEDYSRTEDHGNRAAFDIDLCKAVAVAVLGPGARLIVKSFPDEPFALRALRGGEVDLVATASLSVANTAHDVALSPPILMDGEGFLYPNNPAIHSGVDLAGKKVCFLTGSKAEQGIRSYADAHHITFIWYPFSEAGEMEAAFFTGNCDAVTGDFTQLANIRGIDARRAAAFTILPETIRQDPLAVATWAGDVRFGAIVRWTVELLLEAEALDLTQASVAAAKASPRPEVAQLLGPRYGATSELGLRAQWGADVLEAVGNYGEIFDRDLGANSPVRLNRGENRLWTQGGALVPIPVRD